MAVLDLTASLSNILHALRAELIGLGVRSRLVITLLVLGWEHLLIVADDVILQLTHRLILHTRHLAESLGSFVQRIFRRRLQRVAVLVEIRAQQRYGGNLSKRIHESRTEAGQHIQVARSCLDKREQATTVHTLATCQNGLQIVQVVDDEVQRLQLPVTARIHEVHHADVVIHDVVDDVGLGQFRSWFLKCRYYQIGVQFQVLILHNCLKFM